MSNYLSISIVLVVLSIIGTICGTPFIAGIFCGWSLIGIFVSWLIWEENK